MSERPLFPESVTNHVDEYTGLTRFAFSHIMYCACGAIVQRLARQSFKLQIRVRFPVALPIALPARPARSGSPPQADLRDSRWRYQIFLQWNDMLTNWRAEVG